MNSQEHKGNVWFPLGAPLPEPVPLNLFLFKIASRCNLACPYCYVYELRDQGWRGQPTFMDDATLRAGLDRIREHVATHKLPVISVIFHGGEPLLVGAERLDQIATLVRERLTDLTEVRLGLQTNGTLVDESFLRVAKRHRIRVGLSVDGPARHHDKFRFDHHGKGSSALVERTARLLGVNDVFGGILCVVSLEVDPCEVFDYLASLQPATIDLLLPLATYDNLPPGTASLDEVKRYGDWLVRLVELWYPCTKERPDIRFFSSIMLTLLGHRSLVESIGLGIAALVVIESNGDIEAVDSLKACYHGAASTGLNVFKNSFDESLLSPPIMSRQMGEHSLCDTCRSCSYLKVCGGGYQPHRYSEARGFLNPSIYCEALQMTITRIASLVRDDLSRVNVPIPELIKGLADAKVNFQTV